MLGDRFYLEIQGDKVQIAEPWNFSDADFTIIQDKDYFYRKLAFAGNKADLNFVRDQHSNVFDLLLNEYTENGPNSEVYFYYNDLRMRLDFATAETNYYDTFQCQAINDTVLDILNDNKDVKVDLLSDKDIYGNNASKLDLRRSYATAMDIDRESNWKNDKTTEVGTVTSRSLLCVNTIGKINKSDIKDTYTAPVDYTRRDWDSWRVRKLYKFISFKDNYKDVVIDINLDMSVRTYYTGTTQRPQLTLFVGREDLNDSEWYNGVIKHSVASVSANNNTEIINKSERYVFNNVPRGWGVWLCWECRIAGTGVQGGLNITDYGSEINIKGTSYAFGSIINTNTYQNCINNLIKKIVPTANCRFDVNSNFQADNLLFSGNQIRFMEDKPFILTWKDVTEQLKEFGLGYRLEGNTVVFDNIESFYTPNFIYDFDIIDTTSFKITEETKYHVNIFNYKYKKYQALKEGEIEGNAGTINGESQWYIQNKFTDSSLDIDLPISRDKYLLEETRIKALAYNENTSTSDDNTLYLFDKNIGSVVVNETAFLRATFQEDSLSQTFSVRESEFSWVKIGVQLLTMIYFNINGVGKQYQVLQVSDNTIICVRINHTEVLNQDSQFSFSFNANADFNINVSNANDSKSIRQNISNMRAFLNTYNYYTTAPIYNREYKENADFTYNGIKETDPIQSFEHFKLTPKLVEFKAKATFETFKLIEENLNGYCTVKSPLGEVLKFYIKELNLYNNASTCSEADFKVVGQIYE